MPREPERKLAGDRVHGVQAGELRDVQAVVHAGQERLARQRTRFEYQVRDADLGYVLVGADRASGRPAVGAHRGVRVVQVALEHAVDDQVVATRGDAFTIERPAGQALRQERVVGDRDDIGSDPLPDLAGEQRASFDHRLGGE